MREFGINLHFISVKTQDIDLSLDELDIIFES